MHYQFEAPDAHRSASSLTRWHPPILINSSLGAILVFLSTEVQVQFLEKIPETIVPLQSRL